MVSALELFIFFIDSLFSFCYAKRYGSRGGWGGGAWGDSSHGPMPAPSEILVPPTQCRLSCGEKMCKKLFLAEFNM